MDVSLTELETKINDWITDFDNEWHNHTDDIMVLVERYAEQRYKQGRQDGIYDDNKAFPRKGW